MTGFWIAATALVVVSVALVVWPLVRRARADPAPAEDPDLRLAREQLVQVDRDLGDGLIGAEEAAAVRLEIKRRMLAAAERAAGAPSGKAGTGQAVVTVLATVLPLAAFALYLRLGSPQMPDVPLAARRSGDEVAAAARLPPERRAMLEQALATLEQRIASRPDDVDAWRFLGLTHGALGRPADAAAALRRAYALAPERPDVAAEFGEALVSAERGRVTDEARAVFAGLRATEPGEPRARYYLALRRAQEGDLAGALADWRELIALSPADAPWLEQVRRQAERAEAELAARGDRPPTPDPSAADVDRAAAPSPEERAEMIRSMVDRLAARLAEQPHDRDGWLRLARAYEVLGEADKAREARARAAALPAPETSPGGR